jgi:hypothetical protein
METIWIPSLQPGEGAEPQLFTQVLLTKSLPGAETGNRLHHNNERLFQENEDCSVTPQVRVPAQLLLLGSANE